MLGFFLYSPYVVLGLVGGALADRWDRQRTMVVTQALLAVAAGLLAFVVYARVDSVIVIDMLALVRGTIQAFNNPSRQALIVQLVGRSELPNAIALNSSLNNATRIIGPAIAGVLIASVGVGMCFLLNAISFVAVIVALLAMRPAEFHVASMTRSALPILQSIREGLNYARRRKTIAIALVMLFIVATVAINFNVTLPILARNTLGGDAQTYGLIMSVFGLGAFAGAVTTASRSRASVSLLLGAAAGFGVAQVIVATQHSVLGDALALFVTGVCYTLYTASSNALVQMATPGRMQGRIAGLSNYMLLSSGPLGSLLSGRLCEYGAPLAFLVGGVATLAVAIAGFLLRPWPMPTGSVRPRRRRIAGKKVASEG